MKITKPAPVWLSEADVRALVVSARKAKADLVAIVEGIEAKVAKRRDELNRSLADLDTRARLQAIDAAASTLKITLKNETNARRVELLRSIARMNDQAKGAIEFYENPVHVLLRQTIASAKRSTVFENLAAAGPAELKAFASLAVATKDADMASAVVGRLHAIQPSTARPVSPRYVADALVGEVQREMHGGLLEVDSIMTEAALANRLFEQGRAGTSGIGTVEAALKRRRLAEVGGKAVEDAE
jgi:hypothetical protein